NLTKTRNIFDTAGHLASVQRVRSVGPPQTLWTASGFDAWNAETGATFGNGVQTSYARYPLSRRLQRMSSTSPSAGTVQDLEYTYDALANVKSIVDHTYSGTATGERL